MVCGDGFCFRCVAVNRLSMEYSGDQHLWERIEGDNVSSLVLLRLNLSFRPTGKKEGGSLTGRMLSCQREAFVLLSTKSVVMEGQNSMAVLNG